MTHSFRLQLASRGIDPGKIEVITNGVDLERFAFRAKDVALEAQLDLGGRFVSGYVGTHGMAHALETLLLAAQLLAAKPNGDLYRILFLGDGACKAALREQAERVGLRNVLFLDSVAKDQVARYWSLLDVSVIHLRKTPLFETVIPSKLFECLGMGIPVLLGVAGESARIVEQEGVGLVVEPENPEALAAGIERFFSDPDFHALCRKNCLVAARNYDRKELARRMLVAIERIVPSRPNKTGR